MTNEEREALKAELRAELLAELKPKPTPAVEVRNWQLPGRDYTEGMGMPANALRGMVDATPDAVMREIAGDRFASAPASALPEPKGVPVAREELPVNRSGWRDPAPLSSPAGVAIADKIMDAADERDRVALFEVEARRELARRTMKP